MKATITVEWGNELHTLNLTARNWKRVRNGHALSIRGKGYYADGVFFWDYWHFNDALSGDLRVDYGEDGGCGFDGRIEEADIQEHE